MTIIQAIILAIIEGITEFLPISSTGHMILASSVMGIASAEFTKTFTVAIQLGAILSVVVLYYRTFLKSINFYFKLLVAFIPAGIAGALLGNKIDALLENVEVVGYTLLIGGIVLLFIDKWFSPAGDPKDEKEVTSKKAFFIGVFQCVALIPGVSRAAATIVGGLSQKLTRRAAAEFSFFLAVPTMFAATAYKLFKYYKEGYSFHQAEMSNLVIGNVVAFLVAMVAIRFFITYLSRHGFRMFGIYRIIIGIITLALYYSGFSLDIPK